MGCPAPEQLDALRAGTASVEARAAVLDHAASCDECRAVIDALLASSSEAIGATAPAGASIDPALPPQVARYAIRSELGRGAMGVVYAAYDPDLARDVAVKVTRVRPRSTEARLRREAQALARLAHPNVVRIYDVGVHDGQTYFAMELVDGANLREWLRTPRTVAEIVAVLVPAARGLAAAHAAGLIHRDFKPDNVLIAKSGQVLVSDFGLARETAPSSDDAVVASEDGAPTAVVPAPLSSETLTATGATVGTPAYMAPEQAAGEAEAASDQFAFCVTAWEACFGRRPFAGDSASELRAAARSGAIERPADREVPRRIEAALRRGLAAAPAARFPSMRALIDELAPRPRRRWPWVVGGAVVLVGGAAAAFAATRGSGRGVDCAQAGAVLDATWNAEARARIVAGPGAETAGVIDAYADGWRAARVGFCRATHERREQTVATLEHQVSCLDGQRERLRTTLTTLATDEPASRGATRLIEALPSPTRCARAGAAPTPAPEQAATVATLETELVEYEDHVAIESPLALPGMVALRERIERAGYTPQILRALIAEAQTAAWLGEQVTAAAALRRVILAAEAAGDDFARATASARLAAVLATSSPAEAAAMLDVARAALDRAGGDPAIEQALAEAEASVAIAVEDYPRAVRAQARAIEQMKARFGDRNKSAIAYAYRRYATLLVQNDEFQASVDAHAVANQILAETGPGAAERGKEATELQQAMVAGDFPRAVEISLEQIALMNQENWPAQLRAQGFSMLGLAYELDGRLVEAEAAYREAAAQWGAPTDRLIEVGLPVEPDAIHEGILENEFSAAAVVAQRGQHAAAVTELRRVLAREDASPTSFADPKRRDAIVRELGIALVATRAYADARALLEPSVMRFPERRDLKPLTRARGRYALAEVLWGVGSRADRARALALLDDVERDLDAAIVDGEAKPSLRKLPAVARALRARVATWRAAHPVP